MIDSNVLTLQLNVNPTTIPAVTAPLNVKALKTYKGLVEVPERNSKLF